MRHSLSRLLVAAALSLGPCPALADLPLKPARTITLAPERITWASLDVAPDGQTLVFDMLGDLFAMPATGGAARQLTEGLGFDAQPRFSPDGAWIAFTSDRDGAENLWIARGDGSAARRLSAFDDDTVMVSPTWSADGRDIFVSRFRPDLNAYELWRMPLAGAPQLLVPVKPSANAPRDAWRSSLDASASPDGRSLYFARRLGNPDFDAPVPWTIVRRDLASGIEETVIAPAGGRGGGEEAVFAPRVSPDGRSLAYVTRREGRSVLRLRDLASGADRALGETDLDALQASSWSGMVPGMAFTPDGKAIVLSHEGRFERRSLDGSQTGVLPRSIAARVALGPSTRVALQEPTGPVTSRLAMAPATSPDGRKFAFAALGGLWMAGMDGKPARHLPLPAGAGLPAQPAWSADGRDLAFVTWAEGEGSALWTVAASGDAAPERIPLPPAYLRSPVFAPGGKALLVLRSPLEERRRQVFEYGPIRDGELIEVPLSGGAERVIARGRFGGRPHFTREAGAVFLLSEGGLVRVSLADGATRPVARVTGPGYYFSEGPADADDLRLSPDGARVAASVGDRLYVLPLPADPMRAADVRDPASGAGLMAGSGADWFEWSGPRRLDATLGHHLTRHDAASGRVVAGAPLIARLPRAEPAGSVVLQGARVLTMTGVPGTPSGGVLATGDVLVTGGRIAAVGPHGTLKVPDGAQVIDLTGKTLLPGFIDVHDHIGEIRRGNWAQDSWGLAARLAFGVTASFDPSTLSVDQMGYEGMIDAGLMLAPRLRSTGPAVFSKAGVGSLADARRVVERYAGGYGLTNLKEYRTGSRAARQWLAMAARERGLLPTTEGALALKLDVTQILDGYAGNEHALPAPPIGDDLIALMAAQRTSYVTTLSITNSGSPAMDWLAAREDPVNDDRLRRFWPPFAIDRKLGAGRVVRPVDQMRFRQVARDAARLAQAGGFVGMGSHGEAPGIGFHWEMAAHALGGMSLARVLHAATAGGAEAIGRLDDLGTIEPGKLADLVVLDGDPLADIRNTRRVSLVMRGGFLFDAATLAPVWPHAGPAPQPWFRRAGDEYWPPVPDAPNPEHGAGH